MSLIIAGLLLQPMYQAQMSYSVLIAIKQLLLQFQPEGLFRNISPTCQRLETLEAARSRHFHMLFKP